MLAIETILGALTGYFTNDIAIRQLFAKNGMVVRERAQFTDMIVKVLQEQIIDEETAQSLGEQPEMAAMFEQFIRDLLTEELPYAMSDCALADLDTDGAGYRLLREKLAALDVSDVSLNAEAIHAEIAALLETAPMRLAMQDALAQAGALSLEKLGLGRSLAGRLAVLARLDQAGLNQWLEQWEARVQAACAAAWSSHDAALRVKDVLPVDGTTLEACLEQFLLSRQAAKEARWLDVLKDPAFQEHLYVLTERLLDTLLTEHLSSLVETFKPLLVEDRARIEQMLLESVTDCPEMGDFFREAVLAALQAKFAETTEGKDWLSAFLDKVLAPEHYEDYCHALAQFLLSWVVREIDHWRQVGIDSEDAIAALRQRMLKGRALLIELLNIFLDQPLARVLTPQLMERIVRGLFAYAKAHLTPDQMQAWSALVSGWLARPFADYVLSTQQQEALLDSLSRWWQVQGRGWLAQWPLTGASLKDAVQELLEWLYLQPLSRLLCSGKTSLPYAELAVLLKDMAFTELRPFLGKITKEQIDALSQQEMRELALDMIGREMRPLAYLGGGIGAVVGAATGVAMEASGVTPDPDQVAALMAARIGMYGVVGYGTNVAAVKGLFRPYKKIGCFQGLISKNQSRFAHKMSDVAASYMINDEIWAAQVRRFSDYIDDHFDTLLARSARYFGDVSHGRWQPLLEKMAEQQAGAWLGRVLDRDRVGRLLCASWARCDGVRLLGEWAASRGVYRKGVQRLAMREAANGSLTRAFTQTLHAVPQEAWTDYGNAMLHALVLPTEEKAYRNLWQRCLPYYRSLPAFCCQHVDDFAAMIDAALQPRLSLPLQLGYHMAGGRQLVTAVLRVFFGEKLPVYWQEREDAAADAAVSWMKQQLAGRSLADAGVTFSDNEGAWLSATLAAYSEAQFAPVVLAVFQWQDQLSAAQEAHIVSALTQGLLDAWPALLEEPAAASWQKMWQHVAWEPVTKAMAPVLNVAGQRLVHVSAYDALLSLPDGRLRQLGRELITLDAAQAQVCSALAKQVWAMLSPACVSYLTLEGRSLLALIDVPGLVEARINALSPQVLERLIRDIAQPYFTRVERMGWLGAAVAVPATVISRALGGF